MTNGISARHLQDLLKSGIDTTVALKHDIRTLTNASSIGELLLWKKPEGASKLGPCLYLPYFDSRGNSTGYLRVKPDKPYVGKDGKSAKYLGPIGESVRVYFPLSLNGHYHSPDEPLIITEGEKKALSASLLGFCVVGLGGVSCWSIKRMKDGAGKPIGERQLLPDLAHLPWKGRTVFIAFDSDRLSKKGVLAEENSLAQALQNQGAIVKIVAIPAAAQDQKQGLDDFLVANSAAALQLLLEQATVWQEESISKSVEVGPLDDINNPHLLVERFLNRYFIREDTHNLYWWREQFVVYLDGRYVLRDIEEVKSQLIRFIRHQFQIDAVENEKKKNKSVTASLINVCLQVLKSETNLSHSIEPPHWLIEPDTSPKLTSSNSIALRNGVLRLEDLKLFPCTPNYFCFNVLPYNFDPRASEPKQWKMFLQSLWPGDPESIEALQEWFGYLLTQNTSQQKILFLLGPKRCGKGTIIRVLTQLIGPENTCSPTLHSLESSFGMQPLLHKTAALITDVRLGYRANLAAITEILLSISGEDAQTVNRKHKSHVTGRLPIRFVLVSNELLKFGDASGALIGRFIALRLRQSFFNREDPDLTDKLLAELPGILLWAIEGWRRLRQRRRFVQPASSKHVIRELEMLNAPVVQFVQDECVIEHSARIPKDELFGAWKTWCEANNQSAGSLPTFGRLLKAAYFSISEKRPQQGYERWHEYIGIRLRSPHEFVSNDDYSEAESNSPSSFSFPSGTSGQIQKSSVHIEEEKRENKDHETQSVKEVVGFCPDASDASQSADTWGEQDPGIKMIDEGVFEL